ncbi:MAG: hypothetical protein IID53_14445 [Proteobacteria bacterium]|nr:hypothetical protein [Pseudomonadota bacterium]
MTMPTEDHTCTIEELAAFKFEPIADPSDPMMSLEKWLGRAKREYITTKCILQIMESSDIDFERRIRSHQDPEGFCKALQALVEDIDAWKEHHRASLEVMECAWVRLMTVMARFVDEDDTKARRA